MTNNTPSGAKKHRESTKLESHQMAKMVFLKTKPATKEHNKKGIIYKSHVRTAIISTLAKLDGNRYKTQ